MGVEVSTGTTADDDGVSQSTPEISNEGVSTQPSLAPRNRVAHSARAGGGRSGSDRHEEGSLVNKRKVLVGAKMGDDDSAQISSPASAGVSSSVRSTPHAHSSRTTQFALATMTTSSGTRVKSPNSKARGSSSSPSTRPTTRVDKDRADSTTNLGSTSEIYSVVSILADDKSAKESDLTVAPRPRPSSLRNGAPAAKRMNVGVTSGTIISVPAKARVAQPNSTHERRQKHGALSTDQCSNDKNSSGSGVLSNESEMEFRPSDVNAFFDGSGHSSSDMPTNKDTEAAAPPLPLHLRSLLRPPKASINATALDRVPSAVLSPMSRSVGNVSNARGSGGLARTGSVLSSHEEGVGTRVTPDSGRDKLTGKVTSSDLKIKFSLRGQLSSPDNSSVKASTQRGTTLARQSRSSAFDMGAGRERGGTLHASRHHDEKKTDSKNADAVSSLRRSASYFSGSQLDLATRTPSSTPPVGMGSLYESKVENGVESDTDGFYGSSKAVTSLYNGLLDERDHETSVEAANSFYQTTDEQAQLAQTSMTRHADTSRNSARDTETLNSPNGNLTGSSNSYFAMRDRSYAQSASSGVSSQANSHVNRCMHSPKTTTTSVPQNHTGCGEGGGDANPHTHSATAAREDCLLSPKKGSCAAGGEGGDGTASNASSNTRVVDLVDLPTAVSTSSLFEVKASLNPKRRAAKEGADCRGVELDSLGGSSPISSDQYDLMEADGGQTHRRPHRTASNASSRAGSRGSYRSLPDSVASSAASSRSSSVSSSVSRRDVNVLQRRAAAHVSRSCGASVSGNFQGRYMNAGVRRRSHASGVGDDVLYTPAGGEIIGVDAGLVPLTPSDSAGGLYRGLSGSARRRRGTQTTFADDDRDSAGALGSGRKGHGFSGATPPSTHDNYGKLLTRSSSQNGISTDGSGATRHTEDDSTSFEQREAKASILVQLSHNTSGGSWNGHNEGDRGLPARSGRPPATSFKPLTITADKFKAYQQAYGLTDVP